MAVEHGRHQVLIVDHADDAVDIPLEHRKARIARSHHAVHRLAHGFGTLHQDHIHARRHDLAGVHVAQVQDLMDHALLVIKQIVAVRHEILDLVLSRQGLALRCAQKAENALQPLFNVVVFVFPVHALKPLLVIISF